jgi:hypothetical protein
MEFSFECEKSLNFDFGGKRVSSDGKGEDSFFGLELLFSFDGAKDLNFDLDGIVVSPEDEFIGECNWCSSFVVDLDGSFFGFGMEISSEGEIAPDVDI